MLAASDSEASLKDCKWLVIPTLFVPLEDTRLSSKESAKLANLTDLQWDFFFTCWRYNTDFWRKWKLMEWKHNLGIPIYTACWVERSSGRH